ncbi:uncharacterized protein ASPGLDRAFT_60395 [Aspergillus glaucus CBS 516.65]|uniref:Uncharacterized protein n=1 Tax=Aspergillus glaucus CBS 516.65 TaxID=1160497 RepID=A0A1L9VB57_ASPGL|nr:hypothetical protein ASPGLDRAFT_60395 [Aspergillus glaucus CBS 516.65]OJJ81062.1 hypothetical protein ASPGLDRAFT_60395 [Aspergillus glaucus CBS 516.65]
MSSADTSNSETRTQVSQPATAPDMSHPLGCISKRCGHVCYKPPANDPEINFHVALHSLAETLTSDHLHYVIWINDERTFLQTLQPSEPILAFAAGHNLLRYPRVRLAAIAALHENVSKGFDDLMHNPEI